MRTLGFISIVLALACLSFLLPPVPASNVQNFQPTLTGTFAARPTTALNGALYIPNNGYALARWSGSAFVSFGPLYPMSEPTDPGTWVNQGTSTITTSGGALVLVPQSSATDSLRCRVATAPATPWTRAFAFSGLAADAANVQYGAMFRNSGAGTIHTCAIGLNATAASGTFGSSKWTNATTFSANYAFAAWRFLAPLQWIRIGDDGVNRTCEVSIDGLTWISAFSVVRTDFLTADQFGFYMNAANSQTGAVIVHSLQ